MTDIYYASFLDRLKAGITKKHPGMAKKRGCSSTAIHRFIQAVLTEMISRALKKTISGKELGTWRNIGLSVLNLEEIILKNKARLLSFISNQVTYLTLVYLYQRIEEQFLIA